MNCNVSYLVPSSYVPVVFPGLAMAERTREYLHMWMQTAIEWMQMVVSLERYVSLIMHCGANGLFSSANKGNNIFGPQIRHKKNLPVLATSVNPECLLFSKNFSLYFFTSFFVPKSLHKESSSL